MTFMVQIGSQGADCGNNLAGIDPHRLILYKADILIVDDDMLSAVETSLLRGKLPTSFRNHPPNSTFI